MKTELREYVKETFFHELDRVSNRTDWFLIFHAILFEAFFACKEKDEYGYIPMAVIGLIGILMSYIWLMNGIRAWNTLAQIGNYMSDSKIMGDDDTDNVVKRTNPQIPQNVAEMHNRIFFDRKKTYLKGKIYSWAGDVPTFAIAIPSLFLIAWLIILWYYLCFFLIVISVIAMVLISLIIHCIGPGPGLNKIENQSSENLESSSPHIN